MGSHRRTATVVIAVLSMLASAAVVRAQIEVSAGYDLFTTDPSTTNLLGIPFVGDAGAIPVFDFEPPPASADRRRAIGDTDTVVHRLESASAPTVPGTADPIAIELVLLRLVSAVEFDFDGDGSPDGPVFVTLQKDRDPAGEVRRNFDLDPPEEDVLPGPRSFGEMAITFASAAGGSFDSELHVYADLRIGAPDGPIACGASAGLPPCSAFDAGLTLASVGSAWGRDAVPQSITIRGVNYSLAVPDPGAPVDASRDFWAGVDAQTSTTVCVSHGGHPDPGGLPTAHGTCRTSCTTDPIAPASCHNGRDDDCNGTIDDCDEDLFGPSVQAPDDRVFECPQADVSPAVAGFATGTDNCFPATLPAASIAFSDFVTRRCGKTFDLDRIWTATDDCGNDASMPDLQQIRVVDRIAPEITCPDPRTILWTDDRSPTSLGSATGTDACDDYPDIAFSDLSVPGICLSEEVTRTWTATDDCDNATPCEQPIHVRGPKDAIDDLDAFLSGLGLPRGIENSLSAKLEAAARSVCRGNATPAGNQLEAFVNEVLAQRGKMIPAAAADALIDKALAIIDAINEGGACPDRCQG